jgi:hypothetical protein
MCSGGRLIADFRAGTVDHPNVADVVEAQLTLTQDDKWVVWAHKVAAFSTNDGTFIAITGDRYPVDAEARCLRRRHKAPQPDCTCGFHALSVECWRGNLNAVMSRRRSNAGPVRLDVALTGRVLAFQWIGGAVLFRAERQTVMRVNAPSSTSQITSSNPWQMPPDDPAGWLAAHHDGAPRGAGPFQLRLPESAPAQVALADDAGYCLLQTDAVLEGSQRALLGV